MSATESGLLTRIDRLEDSEVLEAGRYYFADMVDAKSQADITAAISQEVADLGGNPDEFAEARKRLAAESASAVELVRFLLRVAAHGSETDQLELEEALDGVGQKQFLIETALVVGLATLVSLYHQHQTGGVKSKKKEIEFDITPDGHIKGTYKEEIINQSQASALGQFFGLLRALPGPKGGR